MIRKEVAVVAAMMTTMISSLKARHVHSSCTRTKYNYVVEQKSSVAAWLRVASRMAVTATAEAGQITPGNSSRIALTRV